MNTLLLLFLFVIFEGVGISDPGSNASAPVGIAVILRRCWN